MEMSKDKIRNQILKAFQDNVYPGDRLLVSLNPLVYGEHQEYYEQIQGKTWVDLLNELDSLEGPDLWYFSAIFSFLTPEAFLYYLPAFLITTMDPGRADAITDSLLYALDPNGNNTIFANRVIKKLSNNQKQIVGKVLA